MSGGSEGDSPLKDGEEGSGVGIGVSFGRAACYRIVSKDWHAFVSCASNRLEQLMENMRLAWSCGGFGVWQTEQDSWCCKFLAIRRCFFSSWSLCILNKNS